ncbi:MAG: glycosyl hydrolase 53 family protein, partial [Muribaculaceae bacterium]|nr:glycosyl hydrolase 53 family protein [Muribaculaceae bacterium]
MKRISLFLLTLAISLNVLAETRLVGGDMSMLPKYEEAGVAYFTPEGSAIDNLLNYMRDEAGFNTVRVRLFVNPTGENGVVQDVDYVASLGARIKSAGMKFLLDFHYSDTWADPASQ